MRVKTAEETAPAMRATPIAHPRNRKPGSGGRHEIGVRADHREENAGQGRAPVEPEPAPKPAVESVSLIEAHIPKAEARGFW